MIVVFGVSKKVSGLRLKEIIKDNCLIDSTIDKEFINYKEKGIIYDFL